MEDFRVLITERCNASCPTCFNKDIRRGREMSLEDFKRLCRYLKEEGKVSKLKIMGGEPTVHPHFEECVFFAQTQFDSIHVFTNAINDKIEHIQLREKDSIVYNVSCLPRDVKKSRFLLDQKGYRLFETQLAGDVDVGAIKNVLSRVRDIISDDRMHVALTLNCIENIFEHKEKIIAIWNDMADFVLNELGMQFKIDHNIPYCFFVGSNMKIKIDNSLCNTRCAGLITPSLQLQYCNQSPDILADVSCGDRFIPFFILENRLNEYYHKKMLCNLDKICRNCVLFNSKCNGGCFMHKDVNTLDSIIKNSSFPFND